MTSILILIDTPFGCFAKFVTDIQESSIKFVRPGLVVIKLILVHACRTHQSQTKIR